MLKLYFKILFLILLTTASAEDFSSVRFESVLSYSDPDVLPLEQHSGANNKQVACKHLKAVNNLDELLHQFYIHLDSDCINNTPVDVLEKIWGVPVFEEYLYDMPIHFSFMHEDENPYNNALRYRATTMTKRMSSAIENIREIDYTTFIRNHRFSKDNGYVVQKKCIPNKGHSCYYRITDANQYFDTSKSLLPNNQFPSNLPRPSKEGNDTYFFETHFSLRFPPNIQTIYRKEIPKGQLDDCFNDFCLRLPGRFFYVWRQVDNGNYIRFSHSYYRVKQISIRIKNTSIENDDHAKQIVDTDRHTDTNQHCKNLSSVNTLNELLNQIYSQLGSDCLINTPTKVLEKAWRVPIYEYKPIGSSYYTKKEYYNVELDERKKTYRISRKKFAPFGNPVAWQRNKDFSNFYEQPNIIKNKGKFPYYLSRNCVEFGHTTCVFLITSANAKIFPDNRFPESLPKPSKYKFIKPTDYGDKTFFSHEVPQGDWVECLDPHSEIDCYEKYNIYYQWAKGNNYMFFAPKNNVSVSYIAVRILKTKEKH